MAKNTPQDKQEVQEVKNISFNITADPKYNPDSPEFDADAYRELLNTDEMKAKIQQMNKDLTKQWEEMGKRILNMAQATVNDIALPELTELADKIKKLGTRIKRIEQTHNDGFLDYIQTIEIYLLDELYEVAEKDPSYNEYTLFSILEQGFNPDGTPKDNSVFKDIIEKAIKKKADAGIPKITAKPTNYFDLPVDKVNNTVWHTQSNKITIDTTQGDTKKKGQHDAAIMCKINFDELEETPNIKITKQLTDFDKKVYLTAAALYDAGNVVTTATQIYKTMSNGNSRPTPKQLQKINDSLTKMGSTRIYIDNYAEVEAGYNYPKFKYDANLLVFERIECEINGQKTTAIHQFQEPPLVAFAKARKQFTTMTIKALQSPVSNTPSNNAIELYLLERIPHIKTGNGQPKILYKTIFEKCKIEKSKEKRRKKDIIKELLDYYKKENIIDNYKEEKDGVYIYVSDATKKKRP